MTYRNRRLLNIAHEMPCRATFPHQCTGYNGCEPAHADWQVFGRGKDHKSADWAFAAMCHEAHRMITAKINPEFDREMRQAEWLRAFVATQNWLWENERIRVSA